MEDQTQVSLYQKALLAENKNPVGFDIEIGHITYSAQGYNPACGDEILIACNMSNNVIQNIGFSGDSCAICRASASILCQICVQQTKEVALHFGEQILNYINNGKCDVSLPDIAEPLLAIRKFPIRQQCGTLPWSTLISAIKKESN